MLRKLSAIGTIDACQVATPAAHLRLKAQQISVNIAMPRISHAMGASLSSLSGLGGRARQPETRKRPHAGAQRARVVDRVGFEPT